MADIAVGQRYKLLRRIGNDVNEDGSPGDPLQEGWVGSVLAFSPADEYGASHHEGDCWVLAFEVPALVYVDGQPQVGHATRNYAVSPSELQDPSFYELQEVSDGG
ncbi:MAG: hypothetical protein ABR532_08965 [Candidatus Dormibacteria bacterium]